MKDDGERYRKLMRNSSKALLFSYYESFLEAKEGRVGKPKLYFYIVDHEKQKIRYGLSRQIAKEPGTIKNHAMWFYWDGTEEKKCELAKQASVIFAESFKKKYAKAVDEEYECMKHIDRLNDIYGEIMVGEQKRAWGKLQEMLEVK